MQTQVLWVMVFATHIDIWPSHIAHLSFIFINYLILSPHSPNVFWTWSDSITEFLTLQNSSSYPKNCCSSLVNILPCTRGHPWLGCHPDFSPLSPSSPAHLLTCPLLSGFSLTSLIQATNSSYLNYHNSILSGLPAPTLVHVQLQSHLLAPARESSPKENSVMSLLWPKPSMSPPTAIKSRSRLWAGLQAIYVLTLPYVQAHLWLLPHHISNQTSFSRLD